MSMNDKAYEYYESLSKFLNNEKFYNFDLVDYSGDYPMGISKISIEVEGDWKHDHWLFKDLVNDWVAENGINLFKIDYQEIGESDSDYYTAQYDIFVAPNEDTVSTLNNMSKLFRESLFEGRKISNSRRFLKESSGVKNLSSVNLSNKEELIRFLDKIDLQQDYEISTDDGIDFFYWWTNPKINVSSYPIIQIDYNDNTIFHRECGHNIMMDMWDAINVIRESIPERVENFNESLNEASYGGAFDKVNMVPKEFTYTLHIDNSSQDVTSYVVVIPNGLKALDGSTMDAVVYAEDENGNKINFSSIDEAQKWIDTYKDNLSFHVKNRDELHATPIEKESDDEPLDEGVNSRKVYVVEPHKIDMDLYDIVFIDNGKRASSKRFESYEDAVKFIKRNARYNNWIAGNVDESLNEDTIKTKSGKWVNKGKEGTHGKFKTKKEADAQRKAMFAGGYRESLDEDMVICDIDSLPLSKEDKDLLYRYLGDDASSRLYTNGNSFVFSNWYDSFEFDSLEELMDMVRYDIAEWDKLDKRGL